MIDVFLKRPLLIAGPCSAETESQLMKTAIALKEGGKTDVFRAGVWKPRTRPGNFEGVGAIGLPWLMKVKQETGLPVGIEIASATQAKLALEHDFDMFWIGARTTANPFSVQEIADAIQGIPQPVFIKNPTNPDVELWVGAVERIIQAGIKQVGLIHRGFSAYGNAEYRNVPMWHLALEMKRRLPALPMLIDPSHICGNRHLLQDVWQNAADLHYEGVMLETHCSPDEAWSDANQQITPKQYQEMEAAIVWRKETVNSGVDHEKLEKMRHQIQQMDDVILDLLGQRMKVVDKIGAYKRQHNITILQADIWNRIIEHAHKRGALLGLNATFIAQFLDALHIESIQHQYEVMNKKSN